MSEPRRHHLVPEWYLRRFADDKRKIAVADVRERKKYVGNTLKVGAEVGFYDVDSPDLPRDAVEQLLGTIESPARGAVEEIVGSGAAALTIDERRDVAYFVAAQILRGADRRAMSDELTDAMAKASLVGASSKRLKQHLELQLGRPATTAEYEGFRDFARDTSGYTVRSSGAVVRILVDHLVPHAEFLLREFSWTVVRYQLPVLISCDVPVGLARLPGQQDWRGVGIVTADIIRVPLDPQHSLVLHASEPSSQHFVEGVIPGTNEDLLDTLNSVVGWAYRWVFMHPSNPLFADFEYPERREPGREARDIVEMARKIRMIHDVADESDI